MAYSIRFPRRHDRATNDGLYAIRLCVTKDKRRKYIALNLYVAPEHWDEVNEQFIIRRNLKGATQKQRTNSEKSIMCYYRNTKLGREGLSNDSKWRVWIGR